MFLDFHSRLSPRLSCQLLSGFVGQCKALTRDWRLSGREKPRYHTHTHTRTSCQTILSKVCVLGWTPYETPSPFYTPRIIPFSPLHPHCHWLTSSSLHHLSPTSWWQNGCPLSYVSSCNPSSTLLQTELSKVMIRYYSPFNLADNHLQRKISYK